MSDLECICESYDAVLAARWRPSHPIHGFGHGALDGGMHRCMLLTTAEDRASFVAWAEGLPMFGAPGDVDEGGSVITRPPTDIERVCTWAVSEEAGRHAAEEKLLAERSLNAELLEVLKEVRVWIKNWSPSFVQDDEWPVTQSKMNAAIAKADQPR